MDKYLADSYRNKIKNFKELSSKEKSKYEEHCLNSNMVSAFFECDKREALKKIDDLKELFNFINYLKSEPQIVEERFLDLELPKEYEPLKNKVKSMRVNEKLYEEWGTLLKEHPELKKKKKAEVLNLTLLDAVKYLKKNGEQNG